MGDTAYSVDARSTVLREGLAIKVLRRYPRLMLRAAAPGVLLMGAALPHLAAQTLERPESPADNAQEKLPAMLAAPTTRDHIGRVLVKVMVNGQGPFPFIVDTGASHSTISPSLAATLGLKSSSTETIELSGITGSAVVSAVTVEKLQAGTWTIENTAMPVLWAPVMADAQGILGAAGLSGESLVIDFQHDRVLIAGAVDPAIVSEATRVHAERLTDGMMTIDARVGGIRLKAVIDTGSERTLCNQPLRDALDRRRNGKVTVRLTSVYGATEETATGELVQAPMIAVGSLRVTNVDLVCGDFHIFQRWGMQEKPALIIGMDVLGTVNALGIDFKHHDLYVSGTRSRGDPFLPIRSYTVGSQPR